MSSSIAQVVVGLPVKGPFDYAVHPALQNSIQLGMRVLVSFNRKKRVAYVVRLKATSVFKELNPILEILENEPSITPQALKFSKKFAQYYGCSWGEAIETYLPKALRIKRAIALEAPVSVKIPKQSSKPFQLRHRLSLDDIWPDFIQQIQNTLDQNRGVLVTSPDKFSSDKIYKRLAEEFPGDIAGVKDRIKVREVVTLFQDLYRGDKKLFVGTRSAIFAPVPHIGLILVTEEEHLSYKQEQSPHYHTVELAQLRAEIEQARLILTSAVPTTETWKKAQSLKWDKESDIPGNKKKIQIVDMNNYNPRKSSIISFPLQNQIQKMVEQRKKVLLLLNRRGFNLTTQCNQCGHQLKCDRCDVALTYMYSRKQLICRQCNFTTEPLKCCPGCKGNYLRTMGSGIEKLESDLARIYPHVFIAAFDRDTIKLNPKADIVIATQAILNQREHFKPDLVGLLNVDSPLHHFDYRSTHHVFALMIHLYQMTNEQIVVQTKFPDMGHIKAFQKLDFDKFYKEDLKQRRELSLPPFCHILAVGLRGKNEGAVFQAGCDLAQLLQKQSTEKVTVLDPMPDAIPKLRDQYRYTIMLKSKSLATMHLLVKQTLKEFKKRGVIVTLTVDP